MTATPGTVHLFAEFDNTSPMPFCDEQFADVSENVNEVTCRECLLKAIAQWERRAGGARARLESMVSP